MDDPREQPELKVHEHPALPLGGVGLFLAVNGALVLGDRFDPYFLAASGIVVALGVVDDRFGLPPLLRLGVEVIAGIVLVWGLTPRPVFAVFAVVLVVLAINAVNLFDGLDGLAGSVGVVTAIGLGLISAGAGVDLALFLALALAGFLLLNWHPARVFLGDSGAYLTGMTLAYLIVLAAEGLGGLLLASTMLGVFVIDLAFTLVRRWRSGHPLFTGDRSHLYDRLRDRGISVPAITVIASAAQALVVTVVVLLT